jgi:hypothetical protein
VRHGLSWLRSELQGRLTIKRGQNYGNALQAADEGNSATTASGSLSPPTAGELVRYFDTHTDGPGIFKWRHYLPIYERHLAHFRGRAARLLEIGVYSGGSLRMWRDYLGPNAHITGIDIEPACKAYESAGISITIGDQGDPDFWRGFVSDTLPFDAVIDDGSHNWRHQILTLEALVGHLRPGGIFICEDICDPTNRFAQFVEGLERDLHAGAIVSTAGGRQMLATNRAQRLIAAIHRYPLVIVIERTSSPVLRLEGERHGTEWQPFPPFIKHRGSRPVGG